MFLKTLGPNSNGTRITVVSWKAGSRKGRSPQFEVPGLVPAWAKRSSKGCLFENHENRTWHQKTTFHNRSALGPSKNVPGERFWKNIKNLWKNNRKINGFWWSKTIEKYWKTNTFLDFRSFKKTMKNRCRNGSQKSWTIVQNGTRGRPGSIYSSFLSIFGEGEKTWFFDEVPGRPKNKENRPVERQRLEKSPPADNSTTDQSPGVSQHSR